MDFIQNLHVDIAIVTLSLASFGQYLKYCASDSKHVLDMKNHDWNHAIATPFLFWTCDFSGVLHYRLRL